MTPDEVALHEACPAVGALAGPAPLELSQAEQAVLDSEMAKVNEAVDVAWDQAQILKLAREHVHRSADNWHQAAVTVLRLRGLDPAECEAEIVGDHVTLRQRPPAAEPKVLAVEEGPPRVYVAFTEAGLQPETKSLAESYHASFCNTDGETAYFDLLGRLWSEQRGFMLLEEDVLPAPGLIDAMWACSEPWCSVAYEGERQASLHASIACVKFSTNLVRRVPDAMERAIKLAPEKLWPTLDVALCWRILIDEERIVPHWHQPPLVHLRHTRPTEGVPYLPDVMSGSVDSVMDQVTGSRFMLEKTRDLLLLTDSKGPDPAGKPGASGWLNGPLALRQSEPPLPWGLIRKPGQRHL